MTGFGAYWIRLTGTQRLSLSGGLLFVLYLVTIATMASHAKSSRQSLSNRSSEEKPGGEDSQLQLQDFSRIMLRKGRKSLEVRAHSGKFLPIDRVTYLSQAEVIVQRESGKPVKIRAENARLFMDGEQMKLANLEGNVVVEMDDGTEILTELASYDADKQMIRAPERVTIQGQGFESSGDGMEADVENDIVRLLRDTRSRFERGATLPNISQKH